MLYPNSKKLEFLKPFLSVVLILVPILVGFVILVSQINFLFIQKRVNQNLSKINSDIQKDLNLKRFEEMEKQDQRLKRELAEGQILLIEPKTLLTANTNNLPVITIESPTKEEDKKNQFSSSSSNSSEQILIQNQIPETGQNLRGIVAN